MAGGSARRRRWIFEQPIETLAFGRIAVLADPFGNGFCLIEFLGRGYDELCP